MKKILFTIAAVALLASCGNKKAETTEGSTLPVQAAEVLDQAISDGHTAKNSLDYQGTYRATLPTASGEGMEVTIGLEDSTYYKSVSYIGKMSVAVVEEGKYTWNEAGTTITLEGVNVPNQYFVAENSLFQLDIEGNRVAGELADKYKFAKDME